MLETDYLQSPWLTWQGKKLEVFERGHFFFRMQNYQRIEKPLMTSAYYTQTHSNRVMNLPYPHQTINSRFKGFYAHFEENPRMKRRSIFETDDYRSKVVLFQSVSVLCVLVPSFIVFQCSDNSLIENRIFYWKFSKFFPCFRNLLSCIVIVHPILISYIQRTKYGI